MEKKDEIRVLVVEPMKEPYEKIIPNTLEAKQKEVDGYAGKILVVPMQREPVKLNKKGKSR